MLISKKPASTFIIQPHSTLRIIWDSIILIMLVLIGILQPYLSAFEDEGSSFTFSFDLVTMLVFTIDIILNINTSFYHKGKSIVQRKKIFKRYLKTWFIVDFISSLPFSIVYDSLQLNAEKSFLVILRVLKVLKFIRLIRMAQFQQILLKIQERFENYYIIITLQVLNYAFYMFLVSNLFACSMYSVSILDNYPDGFVNKIINKSDHQIYTKGDLYITCLYWSLVTMASVGFGDISPQTTKERLLGAFTMFSSSGMYGILIGLISSSIEKNVEHAKKERENMIGLNKILKEYSVKPGLTEKCRTYLNYVSSKSKSNFISIPRILEDLPVSMKNEITSYSDNSLIFTSNLFNFLSEAQKAELCRIVKTEILSNKDVIIIENQKPEAIYFIRKGSAEIIEAKSSRRVELLKKSQFFGEIGFFTKRNCVSTVVSYGFSELLKINSENFEEFTNKYSNLKKTLEKIIEDTREGDLSCLGVKCYLCNNVGHIATRCSILKKHEELSSFWVNLKQNGRKINPSFMHKAKGQKKKVEFFKGFSRPNVEGRKRKPWEMFKTNSKLRCIVKYFYNKYSQPKFRREEEDDYNLLSYESWRSENESMVKENINMILESSDSKEQD